MILYLSIGALLDSIAYLMVSTLLWIKHWFFFIDIIYLLFMKQSYFLNIVFGAKKNK